MQITAVTSLSGATPDCFLPCCSVVSSVLLCCVLAGWGAALVVFLLACFRLAVGCLKFLLFFWFFVFRF